MLDYSLLKAIYLYFNQLKILFSYNFLILFIKSYTSIFCPKYSPKRVFNNDDPDGCAIFYHTSTFQITQLRCQNININGVNNSQVQRHLHYVAIEHAYFFKINI